MDFRQIDENIQADEGNEVDNLTSLHVKVNGKLVSVEEFRRLRGLPDSKRVGDRNRCLY